MATATKPSAAQQWRERQAQAKQAKKQRQRRTLLAALLVAAAAYWMAPMLRPVLCSATGLSC